MDKFSFLPELMDVDSTETIQNQETSNNNPPEVILEESVTQQYYLSKNQDNKFLWLSWLEL